MIPLTLQLTDFLSYKKPDVLDLSGIHVACLSGANGNGKSALLDAITWSLWGKARGCETGTGQEQLIRDGADTTRVEMTFELDGDVYRVARTRSRNGKADLQFNIRASDGSWTDLAGEGMVGTQTRIIERLRMDYETFTTSAFILQGRADTFTRQKPGERKEILAKILGLEVYERLAERARAYKQHHKVVAESNRSDAERLAAELEEVPKIESEHADSERLAAEAESTREQAAIAQRAAEDELAVLRALKLEVDAIAARAEEARVARALAVEEAERLTLEITQLEGSAHVDDAVTKTAATRSDLEERARQMDASRTRDEQLRHEADHLEHLIELERTRLQGDRARAEQDVVRAQNDLDAAAGIKEAIAKATAERAGLEAAEEEQGRLRAEYRTLSDERSTLTAAIDHRAGQRTELVERVAHLDAADAACPLCEQPLSDDHRAKLAVELDTKDKELDHLDSDAQRRMKEIQKELASVETRGKEAKAKTDRRGVVATQIAAFEETLRRANEAKKILAEATTRAQKITTLLDTNTDLVAEREKLAGIVEQRKSVAYNGQTHNAITKQLEQAREAERLVAAASQAAARLDGSRKLLESAMQKQLTATEAENEAQHELARRADYSKKLVDAETVAAAARGQAGQAQAKVIEYRQTSARLQERLSQLSQVAERATRHREAVKEARALEKRYGYLAKAFGRDGIPAKIVGNAIPDLIHETNRVLGNLTDGRLSVMIELIKQTKAKTTKDTLEITVYDTTGKRAYEMYSGGERLRIDFALRIALSRLLAHRANTKLETLVIDEGFGSQDAEGRARLVEAILRIRGDFRRILVITHVEELKDQFPARIEVSKDPGMGSKVELV